MTAQALANKRYREHPEAHECACGQPAIEWKANAWRCAHCKQLEEDKELDMQVHPQDYPVKDFWFCDAPDAQEVFA